MSLRLRITLLLSVWLLVILLLWGAFVYWMVIRVTIHSELELLQNKADLLIQQDLLSRPDEWRPPSLLSEFLLPREMFRLISPGSAVLHQLYSDPSLLNKPPRYENERRQEVEKNGNQYAIYLKVPVYDRAGNQAAVLEIGHNLSALTEYLKALITVLLGTSAGAVLLALLGGYISTRIWFRPLQRLIRTMHQIEISGVFRQLEPVAGPDSDELVQLGATFNRMMQRLERTFDRQKQFLADASHELRTPLTVIESYASLLRRWGGSDPKLREEALDAIQSESARLKELTKSLLMLTDTDEEERMKWVSFDLGALIAATAASIQRTFDRVIQVRLPEDGHAPLLLQGDPEKIKQLLIILLDNAVKYSTKPIEVAVEPSPRGVLLQVTDQGIGIAPEHLPHLFDRFYRADQARSRKKGGAGLGLSIAENIVHLHGGSIHIASQPGAGTTVTVRLPRP